ncbi:MAG: LysR family transcriptional regulator [Gemmobacter sp.]|jgi:DNA-binding transcriptional LysR family regulator|nr:LysR family transcriptional regulator [Gemmobacter sp.]
MSGLRRNVHSIGALVTFEVAARRGSFSLAAAELGVTQPAVSRQIRLLEADLNMPLFTRAHRRVLLTPAGEALFAAVSAGFGRINETVETIRQPVLPGTVAVGSSLAFSHFWLMPRLSDFRAAHPGIRLRLIADDTFSDMRQDRLDVAIRYGLPPFAGAESVATFPDTVFPGCSPSLRDRLGLDGSMAKLAEAPLLVSDFLDPTWMSWKQWARHADAGPALIRAAELSGLHFNHYSDTIQAALAGEGVVLCRASLLAENLAEGKLVRACDHTVVPEHRFHLLVRSDQPLSPGAAAVASWLSGLFSEINP